MKEFSGVEPLMKAVALAEILPRFNRLRPEEIFNKSENDYATSADRKAEMALGSGLKALLSGSVCLGEEAVHENPGIMAALEEDAPVWIIDPIDGTSNFIRGEADFSVMVALVLNRETVGGWIFAPILGLMAEAVAGEGARLNGNELKITPNENVIDRIVTTHPAYRNAEDERMLAPLNRHQSVKLHARGAGLEYVDLARNLADAAVFTWQNPWDHAAGLLLHREAGGHNASLSGERFRLSGGNDLPIIAARSHSAFNNLRQLLAIDHR
ncbi:inositol monophosphatase (plasmid) [Rhizobium sp. B230/85]|uniref:inositol monophosphatase family protein n=1 Tax=unclassified Rhizobium TaxID=2613769 RepID=UPI001ADD5868|nr:MULTISPECIES: inositol monophosphatase family protein [unclassified Rhizobium]MBO9136429.1 inositol monophosphatase [Rhizobium sp. B209b/85]QXZ99542.1 inositol monophosphatase [Rhizobium sp. B230/85]